MSGDEVSEVELLMHKNFCGFDLCFLFYCTENAMEWYSWFFGSSWLLHFMNNNIDWFQRTEVGRAMARGARLARMTKSTVMTTVKVVTEWKILNLFQKNNLLQSQISCNTKFIFKIFMNETMNLLKTNYQKVFMMAGARSCSFQIVYIDNL